MKKTKVIKNIEKIIQAIWLNGYEDDSSRILKRGVSEDDAYWDTPREKTTKK